MYGEDVDLFLRAKRLGFQTIFLPGNAGRGEVIWHIGSGSSAPSEEMRTINKDPQFVRRILDGMYDNILGHAGWIELVPLLLLHGVFRVTFYALYAFRKSPRRLWALLRTPREPRPRASARKRPRAYGLFLSSYIAVARRTPFPWARRKSACEGEESLVSDLSAPCAKDLRLNGFRESKE
jgi:GT2 family glycosyltransferase